MGTLPWVVVPAFLVPLYLLTHLTIAAQLHATGTQRDTRGDMRHVGHPAGA